MDTHTSMHTENLSYYMIIFYLSTYVFTPLSALLQELVWGEEGTYRVTSLSLYIYIIYIYLSLTVLHLYPDIVMVKLAICLLAYG